MGHIRPLAKDGKKNIHIISKWHSEILIFIFLFVLSTHLYNLKH